MKEANFCGVGGRRDAWHHFESAPRCSWDVGCIAKGQFQKVAGWHNAQISINIEYGTDFITEDMGVKSYMCIFKLANAGVETVNSSHTVCSLAVDSCWARWHGGEKLTLLPSNPSQIKGLSIASVYQTCFVTQHYLPSVEKLSGQRSDAILVNGVTHLISP